VVVVAVIRFVPAAINDAAAAAAFPVVADRVIADPPARRVVLAFNDAAVVFLVLLLLLGALLPLGVDPLPHLLSLSLALLRCLLLAAPVVLAAGASPVVPRPFVEFPP